MDSLPDTADVAGPYVVRAMIFDDVTSDRGFFDDGVTLHYTVNGGTPQSVPMRWSGNALWRGAIPGQPCGTVEYHVEALDFAGNLGIGPADSFILTVPPIPGDLNGDCVVDVSDLLILLGAWGQCGAGPSCPGDLNDDGMVDVTDLLALLANWS
jgi:hypothetical protein